MTSGPAKLMAFAAELTMLHPQAQALLTLIEERGIPPTHTLTPSDARTLYRDRRGFTQPAPPAIGEVRDLSADGPHGPIPVRLYRPLDPVRDTGSGLPVLVYFHGGGWVIGDLDTHDTLCRELANGSGCAVVAVDYRMAPEHRFPTAVDDCITATRWVRQQATALGPDADRLAVGGDSAGGNLAAVVAIAARDAGDLPIRYQLLFYPATDMRRGAPSHTTNGTGYLLTRDTITYFHDHYIDEIRHDLDWRASPLLHTDLSKLPPAGADRRLRPAARRGPPVRRGADEGRQPSDIRLLRAPDPWLHHDGPRARRSQCRGLDVRGGTASRTDRVGAGKRRLTRRLGLARGRLQPAWIAARRSLGSITQVTARVRLRNVPRPASPPLPRAPRPAARAMRRSAPAVQAAGSRPR